MPDASHHIRDLAYRLWEEEGRPEGREAEHWLDAERRFQNVQPTSEATIPTKKPRKSPARTSKAAPAPKRSAKSQDQPTR